MSEPGPWNRQPTTAEGWRPWLKDDEQLLWFYPRREAMREWSVWMLWGTCTAVVAAVFLFDWLVPERPSERHRMLLYGFMAFGMFALFMLILDFLGVRTKLLADRLNEAAAKVRPLSPNSMRTGFSALSHRRFLRITDEGFIAAPISDKALVSEFRLLTNSWSNERQVLLRDLGFREERRLDTALQLARAIREGRAQVPA